MRKLIYSSMVSLDGFVARPNGALDWVLVDEELHTFINNRQREIGMCFYGRGMYEVLRYWETADQDPTLPAFELEFAKIWQKTPKIVFSTTLEEVQGNARLVRDDAVEEVRRQKQQPGKDMEVGGSTLAAAFIRRNMVDVYGLFVQPVVLGEGIPFFPPLGNGNLINWAFVIASEATQSPFASRRLLRRCAPRNDMHKLINSHS